MSSNKNLKLNREPFTHKHNFFEWLAHIGSVHYCNADAQLFDKKGNNLTQK